MTNLILKLFDAKSIKEVDRIIGENITAFIENPKMFIFAKNAKRRIRTIQKEKLKSWQLFEMN